MPVKRPPGNGEYLHHSYSATDKLRNFISIYIWYAAVFGILITLFYLVVLGKIIAKTVMNDQDHPYLKVVIVEAILVIFGGMVLDGGAFLKLVLGLSFIFNFSLLIVPHEKINI